MSHDPPWSEITSSPSPIRPPEPPCPSCHRPVPWGAAQCAHCGIQFAVASDHPDFRKPPSTSPLEFIVPVNTNLWAVLSCYLGLLSLGLPSCSLCAGFPANAELRRILLFFMFIPAIPGLAFGIVALKQRKKEATYGAVTGLLRALIGIALSVSALMLTLLLVALASV